MNNDDSVAHSSSDPQNKQLKAELAALHAQFERAREASTLYQILADTATDAIVSVDDSGVIMYANSSVGKLLGIDYTLLIGQPLHAIIPPEFQNAHHNAFARFQQTGQKTINWNGVEAFVRHSSGEKIPVEISFGAVVGSDGHHRFTGYIRDIRRRKLLEEVERRKIDSLSQASRMKTVGELSMGLAHELNQPLSAICLTADYSRQLLNMLDDPESRDRLSMALLDIAQQSERAAEIVKSLRNLVHKSDPKRVPVVLNELISSVLKISEHYANREGCEVSISLSQNLPKVEVDRIQIEQVLLNLIYNAFDAMPASLDNARRLVIHSSFNERTRMLEIDVFDSGHGVADDDYEKIFENFYTTKAQGMGLGLGISRSIIEAHGGSLTAHKNSPKGTRFQIALPVTGTSFASQN